MNFHRERLRRCIPTKCACCRNKFQKIIEHHRNGNLEDKKKNNISTLCKKCYSFVHHGCNSEYKYYNDRNVLARIGFLRKELLKSKGFKIPKEDYSIKALKPIIF